MKLIDNINQRWGDDLKDSLTPGAKLRIAASSFSIYAFAALQKELEKIDSLEFIFTVPTLVEDKEQPKAAHSTYREFYIPQHQRESNLCGSTFEIQLKNKLTQRAIARECVDWIEHKARFRSNTSTTPMQQFACVQTQEADFAYLPIQGFTAVELGYQQGDALSNFISRIDYASGSQKMRDLFDQMWHNSAQLQDITSQLCEHIGQAYRECAPQEIYLLMLSHIFDKFLAELEQDTLPNDKTGYKNTAIWRKLFDFQKDAAKGIINRLERFSVSILADSVGLGKTFTALAVIKYYELRNRSVLVLCPKKLAENWLTYNKNYTTNTLREDQLRYDVLCHTDLQRAKGESCGIDLQKINWGNYDLVVIDESHNFRNTYAYKEKESRYNTLVRAVIKAGVKTKVLMLSATPVNNGFTDLRNQIALAHEGDSAHLSDLLGINTSIDEAFRRAQTAFNAWSKQPPEQRSAQNLLNALELDFFTLLDGISIARSRRHIQKFYQNNQHIAFPERRKPISFHAPLTRLQQVMNYEQIYTKLGQMQLGVYAPISFVLPSRLPEYEEKYDTQVRGKKERLKHADREKSLCALLRTNLLKRLESSVAAFRLTLQSLQHRHEEALAQIADHQNPETPKQSSPPKKTYQIDPFAGTMRLFEFTQMEAEDEDLNGISEWSTTGKVKVRLADMDLISWERTLKADSRIIAEILRDMEQITPMHDAKLQDLSEHITHKINNPINGAGDTNGGNKKALIFTAFSDTADYLYQYLAPYLRNMGIHSAQVDGRGVKTTLGTGYDFSTILTLFSPLSKEKASILPNDPHEIDLLIGTDCISEGQNLQDCDYVINYDIHWNPVRIIQRFGRIDRIGSPNSCIQLVNYWPDIELDAYIRLKDRVEDRMVAADLAATGADNPISSEQNDMSYRSEQLRRLKDEVIELEEAKQGISLTDLGLNTFRVDLLNHQEQHGDLSSSRHEGSGGGLEPLVRAPGDLSHMPSGLHAVLNSDSVAGLQPGVIFCLKHSAVNSAKQQHNQLHPYSLVYIGQDGQVLYNHSQPKALLELVRAACGGQSQPDRALCNLFNRQTKDGADMSLYSALLERAIESIIQVKEEQDIDSLFTSRQTTALLDTIRGLEDFELIAFLVVMPRDGTPT